MKLLAAQKRFYAEAATWKAVAGSGGSEGNQALNLSPSLTTTDKLASCQAPSSFENTQASPGGIHEGFAVNYAVEEGSGER
jgi:hypothetical protein